MSDSQTVNASYLRGSSEELGKGFWQQWQQYRDYLYHCCIKWMGGNSTDAEDALSRAMLKAWEKVQKYATGEITNFKAWLTTLTRNLCVDIYRERDRGANRVEDIEGYARSDEQELVSPDETPEKALETDEKRMVIRRAIDNLPARLRETFILHFYKELSYQEIAQLQEISYQNVCKRISQARAILREELRGYFIGEDGTDTDKSVPPTATESATGEMFQENAPVEAIAGETVTLSVALEEVESVGGEEAIEVARDVQHLCCFPYFQSKVKSMSGKKRRVGFYRVKLPHNCLIPRKIFGEALRKGRRNRYGIRKKCPNNKNSDLDVGNRLKGVERKNRRRNKMASIIDNIYHKPNGNVGVIIKQPQIENLVFEGGGPKGLVYVGAIKKLEERGILEKVVNVGGSSAGAMTALAVGLGYKADQIRSIINNADISSFLDTRDPLSSCWLPSKLQGISNLFGGVNQGKGYYLGNNLKNWAKDVIINRFEDKKYATWKEELTKFPITFEKLNDLRRKFPELGIKNIAFTGTNYTDARLEVFDWNKTPQMEVDLAVRISMSLPWFFQSVKYQDKEYMDGGCLNNYPMFIFNTPPYFEQGMNRVLTGQQGVFSQNLCTLGLKVDSLEEIQKIMWESAKKETESKWGKLVRAIKNQFVNTLVGVNVTEASKKIDLETYDQYPHRTIQIPDLGHSTFKFKVTEEEKASLANAGYNATSEWLKNYYDNSGVEIEISSRKEWEEFCSLNKTQFASEQITKDYEKVISTLK